MAGGPCSSFRSLQDPQMARATRTAPLTRASGRPSGALTPARPTDPQAATAGRVLMPRLRREALTAGTCGAQAPRPTTGTATAVAGRPVGAAGRAEPRPLGRQPHHLWCSMRAGTLRTGRPCPPTPAVSTYHLPRTHSHSPLETQAWCGDSTLGLGPLSAWGHSLSEVAGAGGAETRPLSWDFQVALRARAQGSVEAGLYCHRDWPPGHFCSVLTNKHPLAAPAATWRQ